MIETHIDQTVTITRGVPWTDARKGAHFETTKQV